MKYQVIYDKSPIFFQNLMATVYGYKTKKYRFATEYHSYLEDLRSVYNYSREELECLQFKELMKLLNNTIEKSKFYRNLYQGININSFKTINDLKSLPIVTKEMIRQNIEDIVTIPKKHCIESSTGGTTGKSLTVYFTKEDMQKRMAILDHFKMMHGFENIKMKRATFSGKYIVPPNQQKKVFWRYNGAINQMLYSTMNISDENIPFYIKSLNDFKPAAIDGYISAIYDIANYMERKKMKLDFVPVAIFPTAETVTRQHRELIERIFRCKIRDQYASSEGAPFVWECSNGELHYDITTGVIENINDSEEILVTSFTTYGTPLIRYKIGDTMVLNKEKNNCSCGINLPIIERIGGRETNYIYLTDGGKISEVATTFNYNPKGLLKYQIVQESLKHIIIKLAVDSSFKDEDKLILEKEVKYKFCSDMQVDFEVVKDIPREKNGKYRLVVNNVSNANGTV